MRRSPLSRAQAFTIGRVLEQSLTKTADGFWEYADGVSDETIAKKHDVAASSVGALRKELFGNMRRGSSENLYGAIHARLAALEKRVTELEDAATADRANSMPKGSNRFNFVVGPNGAKP